MLKFNGQTDIISIWNIVGFNLIMIIIAPFCAKSPLMRAAKKFFCAMFQNLKGNATKRIFFATYLMTGLLREEILWYNVIINTEKIQSG